MIREVYGLAKKSEGITERQFFEIAKKYGLDAENDFERYILRGEEIKVAPDALGNSFKLRESVIPSFDPGFDLGQSLKEEKIIGMKENSPAFSAGLRNDMEILDDENANRFGNAWEPDKPMTIIVKDGSGKRRIEFYPHGLPHKLLLFQP